MNKGHLDAQNYRFDFVENIINEMIIERGGKVETPLDDQDNEAKMKELFG